MKISRSKIELFVECPRCFYLDQKLKIKRPPGFPFSLNNAVDTLLKKEFDRHRAMGTPHPFQSGLNLIPANHPQIDEWRKSLHGGVAYHHPQHGCTYYGGIDDLWIDMQGVYYVVDYKATAKSEIVTSLPEWADGYRRQSEIYQWLLRKNGLNVSNTAYFVYCTGDVHQQSFNKQILFHTHLIPYEGNDSWVDNTLNELNACLTLENPPLHHQDCKYCEFTNKSKLH